MKHAANLPIKAHVFEKQCNWKSVYY